MNASDYLTRLQKHAVYLKEYYYLTKDDVYEKVKIYTDYETIIKNIYVDIYINCKKDEIIDELTYRNRFVMSNLNDSLTQRANYENTMSMQTVTNIYNAIVDDIKLHTCRKCRAKTENILCSQCQSELLDKLKDKIKDQSSEAIKEIICNEINSIAEQNDIGWLQKVTDAAEFNMFKTIGEKAMSAVKMIPISKAIAIAGTAAVIGGATSAGVTTAIVNVTNENTKNGFQLENYVDVSFEGYSGYATPLIEFNKEKLEADLLHMNAMAPPEFAKQLGVFVDSLNVVPVLTDNIANENTFVATIQYDEVLYEQLDLFKLDFQIEIPVKDLEEPQIINIFNYIELNYQGLTGDGQVSVAYTDNNFDFSDIQIILSKSSGLKNGEEIKITASILENTSDFVNNHGFILESTVQKVTLNGFDYYVSSADEIDDISWENMKSHSIDALTKEYTSSHFTVNNINHTGTLLCTPKDNSNDNMIFIICDATVTGHDGKIHNISSYCRFSKSTIENGIVNIKYEDLYLPKNIHTPGTLYTEYYTDRNVFELMFYRIFVYSSKDVLIQDISEVYHLWDIQIVE